MRILLPTFEVLKQLGTIVFRRVSCQLYLGTTMMVEAIISRRRILFDNLTGAIKVVESPVTTIFVLSANTLEVVKFACCFKCDALALDRKSVV